MGKRILIVDDSLVARLILRDILESGGHKVIAEASSGEEAVTKYNELMPDLVIMDIVLPNKNGIDAADEILSMDRRAKIIIISVLDDIPLIQAAFTIGAIDFIHKPFHPAKVLEVVQNVSKIS
ncbi:MAG: two-component system chemotaxis family response regulator [Geobacteraceae bacterium]|nr:MAG: two-component system chemotaxis family response regulator [Geobacteraceae bacterium]